MDTFAGYANPTEEEIVEAYGQALAIEKEGLNELRKLMMAAQAAGLNQKQRYDALTSSGVFESRYNNVLKLASNFSPFYIPSIPPASEKLKDMYRAYEKKAKLKPGVLNFNQEVKNRLELIYRKYNGTSYGFMEELRKSKPVQEED